MAAIDLTAAANSGDPSYVAFWLPFQDPTAHNHIAQWVESLNPSGTDGGNSCIADNAACTSGGTACCNGFCCTSTNVCGCIPIQ
jgi:hypothetical protein